MKVIFVAAIITLIILFFLSGCMEHRYYHDNHYHSSGYDHRHHRTHTGIDINIHN